MARVIKRKIEVGQEVLLPIGKNRLHARVIEDRGHLGAHGERILRVSVDLGEGAPDAEHEVPEEELELVA